MNSQPLVSVCVPTYNDGVFLQQGLCSILNQTYPHLEILVADDGSTDNTPEIVRSIQDPRIQYHRNDKNLGQFENINQCIRRAQGEFVAVFHSDDVYEPMIVEKEARFLETHPEAGAVFALDRRIDSEGQQLGITRLLPGVVPNSCLGLNEVMPVLLRHKNRLIRGPTFMARREVFQRVGWFDATDYDIAGDFEMYLRILTAYKIGILDEHLMRYRRGTTQVSSRYNRLRTCEEPFFPIMDKYLALDGVATAIDPESATEYAFHRCDDQTFRAANWVIRGDTATARNLLRRPFPWRTLLTSSWRRRKLRVLLLRVLMRCGLALGARQPLSRLLVWTEYGGQI